MAKWFEEPGIGYIDQALKHQAWIEEEGGIEHPTHLETLRKPEQQTRIDWLIRRCDSFDILDIGCSWGYILNMVKGKAGIDLNPENIELARQKFPHLSFLVGDVTRGLDIPDQKYRIVIEADILEHIEWFGKVETALSEGLRIAWEKLLITLPWEKRHAFSFKHKWIPDVFKLAQIIGWLIARTKRVTIECDGNFVYLEVIK